MAPKAYLFDMDHTLIDNDCDVSWKEFLLQKGLAEPNATEMAEMFFQQYKNDCLDINQFLRFQLAEFSGKTTEEMAKLSQEHFNTLVKEKIYQAGRKKVEEAIKTGKPVALLTATNKILAKPLADELGISTILACDVKIENGRYLPELSTLYSHGEGKVKYATDFLKAFNIDLNECAYFGDSTSDIPILEKVGYPYAVNPAQGLKERAEAESWKILYFN